MISRRSWLIGCAALPLAAADAQVQPGEPGTAEGELPVRLVREIPHSMLLDASSDGKRLLVFAWNQSLRGFGWRGKWDEKNGPSGRRDGPVRVVDLAAWRYTFSMPAPRSPGGGFFADGETIYVHGLADPGVTYDAVVDLRTGEKKERLTPPHGPDAMVFQYLPLRDPILLGMGRTLHAGARGIEALVKVEFPSFREILRVPYRPMHSPSREETFEADRVISDDRRVFVFTYGNHVACQQTEDLGILWSRLVDNFDEVRVLKVSVSADGGIVAAFAADSSAVEDSKRHYVIFWEGSSGREVGRIDAFAGEGMAISSDGKMLACGLRVPLPGKEPGTQPTIVIYDIASGRKLSALVQDRLVGGRDQFLISGFYGIHFTPGGKYLITSGGTDIKVIPAVRRGTTHNRRVDR